MPVGFEFEEPGEGETKKNQAGEWVRTGCGGEILRCHGCLREFGLFGRAICKLVEDPIRGTIYCGHDPANLGKDSSLAGQLFGFLQS